MAQRRLARGAFEEKHLIRQVERLAVDEVDFHLRRTVLMDEGVDLDILVLADVIEQRVELIHRGDAVGLAAGLGAPGTTHGGLERVVGVLVLLDQIELQLRCHHRIPAALRVQLDDVAQHVARCHRHAPAVGIEAIMDHLRGGLRRPRHAPHCLLIGLEHDVDFRRAHGSAGLQRVVAGHGLQEHALRQAHAPVLGELFRRHDLAAGDASHVGNDGLDLGDAVIAEELPDLTHHTLRPFLD